MKQSDVRYTPPEFWGEVRKLTGINWKLARDATPKHHRVDMLQRPWSARSYYVNPPFSRSRFFVEKILDELDAGRPKRVLLLLPWYQTENVPHRVTSLPKWSKQAQKRMRPYLKGKHSMYVKFIHPDPKIGQYKTPLHVYVFHLER